MNHYDVKAREKERSLVKRLRAGQVVQTGLGFKNPLMRVDQRVIVLTTRKQGELRISRRKLREAISFLFYRRTATRKDLQRYGEYSSALMGLLRLVFIDIAKITKTTGRLLRLSLRGIRYFFGGAERSPKDMDLAKRHGAEFMLLSFAHLRHDRFNRWRYTCEKYNVKPLLDCGKLTEFRATQKGRTVCPITLDEYAAFIMQHKDILFGWLNLDCFGDPEQSQRNADRLKAMGLAPILIWHVQYGFDVLEQMLREDHPVIAIGGTVFLSTRQKRNVFKELFARYPEQNFHFLGGGAPLIYEFPWFSADSTSWLSGRKFGKIITPAGNIKAPDTWSAEECLAYNVQQLSRLEENYTGCYQIQLPIPPVINVK